MKDHMKEDVAFWQNEKGAGMVEYGLLVSLLGVALIMSLAILRADMEDSLDDVGVAIATGGAVEN